MHITRSNSQLVISLGQGEAGFLRRTLQSLVKNYQVPPQEMDSKSSPAWYSTRGSAEAAISKEDVRHGLRHLYDLRSARSTLLKRCLRSLNAAKTNPKKIKLSLAEAPDLIAALNDHRLLLAAQNDIGDAEMNPESIDEWLTLEPSRYHALNEIHLLAHVVERLLHHVAPEAADWPDATDWRPGEPFE